MGLGSWIGRRVLNSTLKGYGVSPDEFNEAISTLKTFSKGAMVRKNQGEGTNQGENQVPTTGYVPDSEEGGETNSTGDAVLDRYYELLSDATTDREIKDLGRAIQDREQFLNRSRVNRENRSGRSKGGDTKDQGTGTNGGGLDTSTLDLTNLAPHASEIADDLIRRFKDLGLPIPNEYAEAAKTYMVGKITERPAIVKEMLDNLGTVIRKYTGGSGSVGGGPQVPKLTFDPAHPEQWAGAMGYDKR